MSRTKWYTRAAEVPGIGYDGDLKLRKTLPQASARPEVSRHGLFWPTPQGGSTASPAHELGFGGAASETADQTRHRVLCALELPGEPSDYHFAIQRGHDSLWDERYQRPDLYALVEWLCWLDLRLLEAHPEVMWIGSRRSEGLLRVTGFERLIDLYATEGFELEAIETGERIARLTDDASWLEDTVKRVKRR